MSEKRIITGFKKRKVRVKSKKKVAPLSKMAMDDIRIEKIIMKAKQVFHISKSVMFPISRVVKIKDNGTSRSTTWMSEVLNQQELEDFEL